MSLNLYCIPYAGSSASVYLPWKKRLAPYGIDVFPLELRGRGKRHDEKVHSNMMETVQDIYECLKEQQADRGIPYVLYGHSMGCVIAFELIRLLHRNKDDMPVHVFLSGRYPPHIVKLHKKIHLLEGLELIQEIRRMGGTDDSILCDSALQDIFFPIIKADYKILETYSYIPSEEKIYCSVTVINGMFDKLVSCDEILMWQEYFENRVNFKYIHGDHFFVRSNIEEVTNTIINVLF